MDEAGHPVEFVTVALNQENGPVIRRRSSRIVALGLRYNLGGSGKKPEDDQFKFDHSL